MSESSCVQTPSETEEIDLLDAQVDAAGVRLGLALDLYRKLGDLGSNDAVIRQAKSNALHGVLTEARIYNDRVAAVALLDDEAEKKATPEGVCTKCRLPFASSVGQESTRVCFTKMFPEGAMGIEMCRFRQAS